MRNEGGLPGFLPERAAGAPSQIEPWQAQKAGMEAKAKEPS
ncbi:hypothetical protein SAMN05661093_06926 [Kibdelosporangium aridum]|uniref:Uncharacterized protein n=1 Tax=Kibdelosporangium aridum TaxID=2030 RepID=A0A1W2FIV3_KIBAR|nr:hypothetical protein SAMN05661093_06926 [Kibdelosporangium aridum]